MTTNIEFLTAIMKEVFELTSQLETTTGFVDTTKVAAQANELIYKITDPDRKFNADERLIKTTIWDQLDKINRQVVDKVRSIMKEVRLVC